MEAVLSGEMFYAFRDKNTGEPLDYSFLGLSGRLQSKIEAWRNMYMVFASMNGNEIKRHTEEVTNLDMQAISLLEEASKEIFSNTWGITRISYFSLYKDNYLAKFSR